MKLRLHGGELASALRQILLQNHGGVLDFVGIVLRIGAQADFALLEPVQDLRLLDRLQAVEIESSDHRAFHQHEGYDPARLPGLIGRGDVVEPIGVPESNEVVIQLVFVERVALLGHDLEPQNILGDATGSPENDVLDDVLGRDCRRLRTRRRRFGSLGFGSFRLGRLRRRSLGHVFKRVGRLGSLRRRSLRHIFKRVGPLSRLARSGLWWIWRRRICRRGLLGVQRGYANRQKTKHQRAQASRPGKRHPKNATLSTLRLQSDAHP